MCLQKADGNLGLLLTPKKGECPHVKVEPHKQRKGFAK